MNMPQENGGDTLRLRGIFPAVCRSFLTAGSWRRGRSNRGYLFFYRALMQVLIRFVNLLKSVSGWRHTQVGHLREDLLGDNGVSFRRVRSRFYMFSFLLFLYFLFLLCHVSISGFFPAIELFHFQSAICRSCRCSPFDAIIKNPLPW